MNLARELADLYTGVALPSITSHRFTQAQMLTWLRPIVDRAGLVLAQAGTSAEGRPIFRIVLGNGPTKVLLWSQMHGDESTATMALLDILNFISLHPDHPLASRIKSALTIIMIPMLNPDGAERFQRRTAQQIDMNRDALRLQTPEARVLRQLQADFRPHFGFNLHDQDARYSVGQSTRVTAIALLAPPVDADRSDNEVRRKAKLLAAHLAETLAEFIPGHIARYDDTFEPRAFGDNIQRSGTSTVLIESGGWMGDPQKMFLRKINFLGILSALDAIATSRFLSTDVSVYENLPFNGKNLYDMILRNVRYTPGVNLAPLSVDIGINLTEETDPATGAPTTIGTVIDLGDLGTMGAFEEIDGFGIALDFREISMDKRLSREEVLRLIEKR